MKRAKSYGRSTGAKLPSERNAPYEGYFQVIELCSHPPCQNTLFPNERKIAQGSFWYQEPSPLCECSLYQFENVYIGSDFIVLEFSLPIHIIGSQCKSTVHDR